MFRDVVSSYIKNDKTRLLTVFVAVFAVGFATHGYFFSNFVLSHDALNEFYLFGPINYYEFYDPSITREYTVAIHKITLGRFFAPIYDIIFRGTVASPWLVGILSLLWFSLCVYVVCLLFKIKSKTEIVIISSIFLTNISLIAETGSFLNDLDSYAFAILLSVLGVCLWNKGKIKYLALSVVCLTMMLGIYQPILSVFIALVIFISIFELLQNNDYKKIIRNGFIAIGVIVAATLAYLFFVRESLIVTKMVLQGGYNSLNNLWQKQGVPIVQIFLDTYIMFFRFIIEQPTIMIKNFSVFLQIALLILMLVSVTVILTKSDKPNINKLFIVLLIFIMPFGLNLSFFSNNGIMHDLMKYAIWMIYLFLLLLVRYIASAHTGNKRMILYGLSTVLLIVMIWGNIKTANAAYTKKELEYQQTFSLMTRIVERMETTEGYVSGETPVVFIGRLDFPERDYFADLYNINGQKYLSTVSSENYLNCYFDYVLNVPVNLVSYYTRDEYATKEDVKNMTAFPSESSIKMMDGVLVVKVNSIYK